jgi:hypothetical protein
MTAQPPSVIRLSDYPFEALASMLSRFGMKLEAVQPDEEIPGSFWGDEEAGLKANRVLVRPDTPLHSVLHEACHYICMDGARRNGLDTNAGGDYDEENAVCFLQILLADYLPDFGSGRMMQDMDAWGYSFRLGSARAWFEQDADDARQTLLNWRLIESTGTPTFQLRDEAGQHE